MVEDCVLYDRLFVLCFGIGFVVYVKCLGFILSLWIARKRFIIQRVLCTALHQANRHHVKRPLNLPENGAADDDDVDDAANSAPLPR